MAYDDPIESWRGRRATYRYGLPGHEWEFCVNVEGYSFSGDDFIPTSLADAVKEALPEEAREMLLNRGTRLELYVEPELADDLERALTEAGLAVVSERDFPW